jgi:YidC/Oxa1 family membrane protein insertase
MNIGFVLLYQPLLNLLVWLSLVSGNLGWAIVALTLLIRFLLLPLTLPSLRAAAKMKELAPRLEKLKKKYQNDKQKLMKAQMDLYRSVGVNPAAGCLPQIVQIIILIALFNVFNKALASSVQMAEVISKDLYSFVHLSPDFQFNTRFFYLDLTKPDVIKIGGLPPLPGVFLILSVLAQFFSAKLMMPTVKKQEKVAEKTPGKEDDFASMMQKQSLYLFPLMTLLIGYRFASGLVVYWLVFSLFTLLQQWVIRERRRNGQKR